VGPKQVLMIEEADLQPFHDFLETVAESKNETSTREAFVTLAAKGFDDSQLSKELALGAEYKVKFVRHGLVRRGAIDSFFGNLVIEFEYDLKKTGDHALEQLRGYCAGAWTEDGSPTRSYLAVAADGRAWRVYAPRLRDPLAPVEDSNVELLPLEEWCAGDQSTDAADLRDFLNRLFYRRLLIAPTAANFVRDFGLNSASYLRAKSVFAGKLAELDGHPQLQVLETAWDASLQAAYGHVETSRELLAQHTYLALLARLMVWAALEKRPLSRKEVGDVLGGVYFQSKMIANLVESDFFRWYEIKSVTDVAPLFVAIANQISGYDLAAIREDILKPLYEELVDPATRHALGEFYTPDWLADRVARRLLDTHDWSAGPPRVLDPACGSGTFLRAAIDVVRATRPTTTLGEVLSCVMGIDVHPLAVTVARATYLLAIQDLIQQASHAITLPIFLSNALTMPAVQRQQDLYGGESLSLRVDEIDYEVPLELVLRGDLYGSTLEDVIAVAKSYGRTDTVVEDAPASLSARLGNSLKDIDPYGTAIAALGKMTKHIAELVREGRNSVHGFLLKNHYRPAMLRSTFDYVMGNPPWLTVGDIEVREYREKVIDRAVASKITSRSVGEQSHTELATIFLAAAFQDYLAPQATTADRPRVGLVLPRSVMTAKHHRFLREGRYDPTKLMCDILEIWDLDGVAPLFNVPACVVFAAAQPARSDHPKSGVEFTGRLPRKDAEVEVANGCLTTREVEYRLAYLGRRSAWKRFEKGETGVGDDIVTPVATYYSTVFRQGAILYPQTALVVVGAIDRSKNQVRVQTDPSVVEGARKLTELVNHVVEPRCVFSTLSAENIVPFATRRPERFIILPVLGDPGTVDFSPVSPDMLRAHGLVRTSDWLAWAEKQWERVRKDGDTSCLHKRLDYLGHLSAQGAREDHIVLYAAAGKRPVATVLKGNDLHLPFVARDRTYHASFASELEAYFVLAFLNSDHLASRISAWINRGLFGPRDINKRALDAAWPKFDATCQEHVELAELGRTLHCEAQGCLSEAPKLATGRLRTWVRGQLDKVRLGQLEALVVDISKTSP
jgi:SAM-dependent methyltransferase